MVFFTFTSIDCGRGVGGGEVRLDANAAEDVGIRCGSTPSVADAGEGQTVGTAVPVAWRLCRMHLARVHGLVELKVEFIFRSVVLGDLKLQLRRASHIVVVLGAGAHHRARAPAQRGRRKGGVRDNVDAIIIKWLACQIQRPRATEEWLNRHGVLCQELGRPEWVHQYVALFYV